MVQQNPAGFLRKSIEEDWKAPKGYFSIEEKQKIKQNRDEIEIRMEWNKKVDEYKKWIEASDDNKIYWDLTKWQKGLEKKGIHPTPNEIEIKKKELINKLPSNEEMQKTIFGKIVYSNTRDLFKSS